VCLADSPRVLSFSRVRRVLACLHFRSGFVLGFCCSRFADGLSFSSERSGSGADGPPGPCRQSVFPSASLVVLLAFTDCPRLLAGLSAAPGRTVRCTWRDCPCGQCRQSAPPGPLSPKVMYLFVTTGTRLENHPLWPVICLEQPESIKQMFFKYPT
jgi:hypothetical protein